MIQVKNRACVRTVAVRSLWASKMRNLIAVIAIMLTTMLFTALFTIAISINDSFQQSNFLMVGGDAHGSFKKLTEEQIKINARQCTDLHMKRYANTVSYNMHRSS